MSKKRWEICIIIYQCAGLPGGDGDSGVGRAGRARRARSTCLLNYLMGTDLETCDVFDQDILRMVLCGRQGREDNRDEVQKACRAGIGLTLCVWVEGCIWLT